jgi:enamine deaminase RidA (YjgF/YER057c/UK114 family)
MVEFTSTVVMSGFLGLDSMKEKIRGNTIQNQILEASRMGVRLCHDPLLLLLGMKFHDKGCRQIDR